MTKSSNDQLKIGIVVEGKTRIRCHTYSLKMHTAHTQTHIHISNRISIRFARKLAGRHIFIFLIMIEQVKRFTKKNCNY